MNVLLFGPPGSGKGTQAQAVAATLGIPHVATGDIFRRHLKEGTELGKKVKAIMESGALVPDGVTCDLVASRLAEPDAAGGVLLDGFPRSVPQARWLLGWLADRGARIDVVLNLVVPDEAIVSRLSGRRTCLTCGSTYHIVHAPADGDRCTRCGGTVVQRPDDREDVVMARLRTYAAETAPVLDVLRPVSRVHDIAGIGSVGEIKERISAALALG